MGIVLKADCAALNMETNISEITGLASYLLRDGLLTITTAKAAIKAAQQQGTSLTNYLVSAELLSSQTIFLCLKRNLALPLVDLKNYDVTLLSDSVIKPEFIWRYRVIPIRRDQDNLHLGMADPTDHAAITAISFHTGLYIHPCLVSEKELDELINTHCRSTLLYSHLETALANIPSRKEPVQQENGKQADEPVIEFVDRLIQEALTKQISDIHIEPYETHCRIRFRRDGLLYEAATIPPLLAQQIISRLKVMALLNIAERRLPQDGRIQIRSEKRIDIRINTCPTLYGEKIVLRLLNTERMNLKIASLGMNPAQQRLFLAKLSQPQGLILVTGPTGSGKTVTLYSALQHLNSIEKNIITIEDPVEIELSGINQVNINQAIGLSFAKALHTFLRQDPDIIMIGEIRDKETAEIAMQAAQTGHLVLATLHTNSAAETITRLQGMGAFYHHLITSISLIIAQRLLRKLCAHCKSCDPVTTFAEHKIFKPIGCERCQNGYNGRIGIFELLPMTERIIKTILSNSEEQQLLEEIKKAGHLLLWDAGLEKVYAGLTSQAELKRIVGR